MRREDYPHDSLHHERLLSTYYAPHRADVYGYRKVYRSEIKSESYAVNDKIVWHKLYDNAGNLKSQSWWDSTGHLCHLHRYDGRNRDSADWVRDPQTGSWTGFGYDDDVLIIKRHYSADSLRNGEWTEYYHSGAIKLRQHYLAGQLHGEYTSWYENGSVAEKGNYRYGIREEGWEYWDQKGQRTTNQ
jgi:antitoxin component YwqK of YwqJK toxin-antitoxin module